MKQDKKTNDIKKPKKSFDQDFKGKQPADKSQHFPEDEQTYLEDEANQTTKEDLMGDNYKEERE